MWYQLSLTYLKTPQSSLRLASSPFRGAFINPCKFYKKSPFQASSERGPPKEVEGLNLKGEGDRRKAMEWFKIVAAGDTLIHHFSFLIHK